jgi:hypothetical protein
MRINAPTRYATLAALVGALACAGNKARTDESAAAKDTTTVGRDTLNENPPGYRGMERDTTQTPNGQTPSDTFLQNQGAGTPQDTAGYSGIERDTTTRQPGQTDTSSIRTDTTGVGGVRDTSMTGADTSGYNRSSSAQDSTSANPSSTNPSATGLDSTGQSKTGDTTGYDQSQQQRDSTSR